VTPPLCDLSIECVFYYPIQLYDEVKIESNKPITITNNIHISTQHSQWKDKYNSRNRKRTTDTTMQYFSNHPTEHKIAAYRSLFTSPPLRRRNDNKQMSYRIIQQIAYANHIPLKWFHKLNSNEEQHITDNQNNNSHKRSITFTYFGPQVRTISNLNTTNSESHSGPQTQYLPF
jgi:hypothetical protein